ncbi:MAG: DUF983 domain-containing protein [Deltaproteobacteria bacterium]|nr:DUF983 domain-containing protein [Deltaproteobacteria bacterium]
MAEPAAPLKSPEPSTALRLWWALGKLRCPACGEGKLYSGWFAMNETCPSCGARFFRWEGSWTGPTVMGYTTGALVAAAAGLAIHSVRGLQDGDQWFFIVAAIIGALAPFHRTKAAWVWTLHRTGWVFRDGDHGTIKGRSSGSAPPLKRA